MPKRGRGRPIIQTVTEPQRRLLQAIEAYIARHGLSPTIRELAQEVGRSIASVFNQVRRLERNGYLSRVAGKSRSITVIRSGNEEPVVELVAIPLVGTVMAGHPLLAQENVLGEVLLDAVTVRAGRHFALKVSGQSMVNAGISSGDVVIIRQQPLADHGDIVVALLNNDATVKRLHYRDGEVSLLPENPRFKPISISPNDDLRIIGKVVAVRVVGTGRK